MKKKMARRPEMGVSKPMLNGYIAIFQSAKAAQVY
jgi:hypothetical protein